MGSKILIITLTCILILIMLISFASAIDLSVKSTPISNTIITDLNEPAIYDLTITNNEETESFTIYSLIGIDIIPNTPTIINSKDTKVIRIQLYPQKSLSSKLETLAFEYEIKNSKNQLEKHTLTVNIMNIEKAISMSPENIDPKSENINIQIKNLATYNFDDLKLKFSSPLFSDYQKDFPLNSMETKVISIPLDKDKLKVANSGHYLGNVEIETKGKKINHEILINFVELPNIETKETNTGTLINKHEIIKNNLGNTNERVRITIQKGFFSYLFTTTKSNSPLTDSKFSGLSRIYSWEKQLNPNENLSVSATTNWFFPMIILVLLILAVFTIKKYVERDFIFRKNVSFVRTKGGEFALRITLKLRAKKFVKKVNITDRLPHLVNLYEKFGAVAPDKIDTHNKRLEWNLESMNRGEEKVFSYIIYSHKVGIIGKFELPAARVVYEQNQKIKHLTSNKAFFINEPVKQMPY